MKKLFKILVLNFNLNYLEEVRDWEFFFVFVFIFWYLINYFLLFWEIDMFMEKGSSI